MKLCVRIPQKKYLSEMKQTFSSPFAVFDSRVTGVILGPFFSVAHYQDYEWNRRITSECNRAFGFVREREGETEISFLRSKGMLSPSWLLGLTLLCRLIFWQAEFDMGSWQLWLLCLGFAAVPCVITAIESSVTRAGQDGEYELLQFLKDPEHFYI